MEEQVEYSEWINLLSRRHTIDLLVERTSYRTTEQISLRVVWIIFYCWYRRLYFCVTPVICEGGGLPTRATRRAGGSLYARVRTRVHGSRREAVDWNYLAVIYDTRGPLTAKTVASILFFFFFTNAPSLTHYADKGEKVAYSVANKRLRGRWKTYRFASYAWIYYRGVCSGVK